MGPQPEATEPEERGGGPTAYEGFWTGLCATIVIITLCLLALHWAGVIH